MIQSFGPRQCTAAEFNSLLLTIVGEASLYFCRQRHEEGLTREQINALLPDHLAMLDRWRADTLQEFTRWCDEPGAPSHATQ